jgi:hypothetical protein
VRERWVRVLLRVEGRAAEEERRGEGGVDGWRSREFRERVLELRDGTDSWETDSKNDEREVSV